MKKIFFILSFMLIFSMQTFAANNLSKCGDYYLDRSNKEVFTVNESGNKLTLGKYRIQPATRFVEVAPGYMEDAFKLNSGIVFNVRSAGKQVWAVLEDQETSTNVGSCVKVNGPRVNANKIGFEYTANDSLFK